MSASKAATIFDATFLLPGLKLAQSKNVVVPDDVKSRAKDDFILVFLKKFEGNLGFLGDTEIMLRAMYQTGGTPLNGDNKEQKIADEADKKEATDDGEKPWDEFDDVFDERTFHDNYVDGEDEPIFLNPLVQESETATKQVDSPSIEGYECFLLKPEEVWKSPKKHSEIELCFFSAETDIPSSKSLLRSDNRGVSVGESFVVDLTETSSNPMLNNIIILEWDMSCILMKEVYSPKEVQVLKNESEIRDDILLLGVRGGNSFDPTEPLVMHVHLYDYLSSGHNELKLKLFNNCEIELNSKKLFDDTVDECIKKSCACDDPVGLLSSSGVSGDYIKFEIDPKIFLQILQASAEGNPETNLFRVLDEQGNKAQETESILDAIEAAQFVAIVEDTKSNELVAEFLLSSIASNSIYFDSAVQMLNVPENRSNEKVTQWSKMMMRTAESSWDSMYTRAAYKVTRSESTLDGDQDMKISDNATSQRFLVKVVLPKINKDVATITPKDIALLVENRDQYLAFVDKNENKKFHYMRDPVRISQSGDEHMIEFEWNAIDRGGVNRNSEMKVSILIELGVKDESEGEVKRPKKIGQTISIVHKVGGASKVHSAMVKMRHMVKTGFEDATLIEGSVSNFLESTFMMVYNFSIPDEQSISYHTFLEKAADDIGNRFYKTVADSKKSEIYDKIHKSDVFLRRNFENSKVIEESELADFTVEIFQSLAAYDLHDWARSIALDEDAHKLLEDNQSIEDLLENHVKNLHRVLQMNSTEVVAQQQKYPEVTQGFVIAAQHVHDEINFPEGLEITDSDFFNESSARDIEKEVQEIEESFDRAIPVAVFEKSEASQVLAENVADLETSLLGLLENSAEFCDTTISAMEDSQQLLSDVHSQLYNLRNLSTNITTLSTNSRNLHNFCKRFWQALQALARVAYGPLAVVKGIISGMKVPMKMILNALANGEKKVSGLSKKVNAKTKSLVNKNLLARVNSLSNMVGRPTAAIEKFREVIDMVISVASLGILPMSLISEFASSKSLENFFQKLSTLIIPIKSTLDNLWGHLNSLQTPMREMKNFCSRIASKLNFIRPVDNLLKRLQPFVNVIAGLFRRFTGWWKYLLNGMMWPVEQAINLIIYPFRRQIDSMIRSINPFGVIDSLMAPLTRPLDALVSYEVFDSNLRKLSTFENLSTISNFDGMKDSFTLVVAIIQRVFFGLIEGLLTQGANNVKVFEELVGEKNTTIEFLLRKMQIEFPDSTLGDFILKIKEEAIDGPMARCSSYLLMNGSKNKHTYVDRFTAEKLKSYVGNSNYDLLHCGINPSEDKVSPLFEYGTIESKANNSWVMAPMALLLHFGKLTEQAERIGALSLEDRVNITFLPEHGDESGQYKISLHARMSGSPEVFDVDSRLPLQKVSLNLGTVEEIPINILDYANERILARVVPAFSEKYSLAMVEKVVALQLNAPATESIGTGMHLLCGNRSGLCYSKETNSTWRKHIVAKDFHTKNGYDAVKLQSTEDIKSDENLLDILKTRTISLEDAERLDSFYRAGPDNINSYDRSTMESVIENLSMFVMVTSAASNRDVFPILYTDNTNERNIVYADGAKIQPLFNLSNILDIWEFTVTSNNPIAEQRLSESISSTSMTSAFIPSTTGAVATRAARPGSRRRGVPAPWGGIRGWLRCLGGSGSTRASRLFSVDSLVVVAGEGAATGAGVGLASGRVVTSRAISPLGQTPPSSGLLGRMVENGFLRSISDFDYQNILRTKIWAALSVAKITSVSNKRKIQRGDYVTSKSNALSEVVRVLLKAEKKGPVTKAVVTGYMVKPLYPSISGQYELNKIDAKRLSEKDKHAWNYIRKILVHKKIFARTSTSKTATLRQLQLNVENAQSWGLTLKGLEAYVKFCQSEFPTTWGNSKSRDRNKFVSIKNLSKDFISKHTKTLGSSIALNMTGGEESKAKIFVSVSWEEDVLQVIDMLKGRIGLPLSTGTFTENTVIWLSAFSLYQSEDENERKIEKQLEKGVFDQVLKSVTDMFVLQSSNCDPYSRLWCVSELYAAMKREDTPTRKDISIKYLFSRDFHDKYVEDLKESVLYNWSNNGTEEKPYWVYTRTLSKDDNTKVLNTGRGRSNTPKYFLMGEEEWGRKDGEGSQVEPLLRINVVGGLTNFNEYSRARETDTAELRKFDEIPGEGKHPLWWNLQKNIVQLQRNAVGAMVSPPQNYSLMHQFTQKVELDQVNNTDLIRRFLKDEARISESSLEKLGYVPQILNPDNKGRVFFLFREDPHATIFFRELMKIAATYDPIGIQYLLSFGSQDPNGFAFPKILWVAEELNSTYVDAIYLPKLAGSYKLNRLGFPRNSFWIEYYKKAMKNAEVMTFIITEGWLESPNTWEELKWTIELRNDAEKYTNLIVFQHLETQKELLSVFERPKPYKTNFKEIAEKDQYNWKDMMDRLTNKRLISAVTKESIAKEVKKHYGKKM